MRALVTGGAGFIGSHLSRRLLSRGVDVTIVDNLKNGFLENVPDGAEFLKVDISHDNWTDTLSGQFDFVFHLAAQSSGEISFEDPMYDLRTNTLGTLALLKWSLENKVNRFVFASSMNVYGVVPDEAIAENWLVNPTSFYGVGKVASEGYIRLFSSLGLRSTVLRLFNVYGPGQNLANMKQGMLSIYCAYVANGEPIIIRGRTDRFRDFVFIDDVVDALERSIKSDRTMDLFNVCSGVRTSVQEAVAGITNAFGYANYPVQVVDGTLGDQFGIYGDNNHIRQNLAWMPKHNLASGLAHMVDWIRAKK